jgi:hypothetical protein
MLAPDPAPAAPPAPAADALAALRVDGAAVVYRLYDVGYEIRLDRALDLLAASAPARVRPVRGEAQALQIANPPLTVILGPERVAVDGLGAPRDAELSARIFDFGVVSLRLRVEAPADAAWPDFVAFGNAVDVGADLSPLFAHHLRLLTERIATAVDRPAVAAQTEDYVVFRVDALRGPDGAPADPAVLDAAAVTPLLLNERRPLSADARRELLPHRFSYYADDLAVLTWDNALVVEPRASDADVQYILEFANAQLLELRHYDAELDALLPAMYDRIADARRGWRRLLRRGYAPLLGDLQARVADSTELVERAENALKVTDDVYLARVYSAALEIFRARAWRAGIDRKLGIVRDTYAMLNGEAQAARGEALEVTIVALILLEVVLALVLRH